MPGFFNLRSSLRLAYALERKTLNFAYTLEDYIGDFAYAIENLWSEFAYVLEILCIFVLVNQIIRHDKTESPE